jgi:hypothetical protein
LRFLRSHGGTWSCGFTAFTSQAPCAVAAGARQYVVLGAGLDTFAYRNPYPADTLRVLALMSRRFARIGEPWRSFFDELKLAGDLRAMGYSRVEDLRAADIAERLFDGNGIVLEHRRAGSKFGGVIRAWV